MDCLAVALRQRKLTYPEGVQDISPGLRRDAGRYPGETNQRIIFPSPPAISGGEGLGGGGALDNLNVTNSLLLEPWPFRTRWTTLKPPLLLLARAGSSREKTNCFAELLNVESLHPAMIAFEVKVNGEKVCTAGIQRFGDLCAHLNWRRGPQVAPATGFLHQDELLEFSVLGVRVQYKPKKAPNLKRGYKYTESLEWVTRRLRPGDRISIQIVKARRADAPLKRKRLS